MNKNRLEAFSDGVMAIIITIMVLELKVPESTEWDALKHESPVFMSYALSFIFLTIYWNNHHHLFQAVRQVNGRILWANAHLLFWLSLIPFTTSWLGSAKFSRDAVIAYSVVLLMCAVAFTTLVYSLIKHHGKDSLIARAMANDVKGKVSLACYVIAIGMAYVNPWVSCAVIVAVAIVWLVPDSRVERLMIGPEAPR